MFNICIILVLFILIVYADVITTTEPEPNLSSSIPTNNIILPRPTLQQFQATILEKHEIKQGLKRNNGSIDIGITNNNNSIEMKSNINKSISNTSVNMNNNESPVIVKEERVIQTDNDIVVEQKTNFASFSSGAKVVSFSPNMKNTESVLMDNTDKYMMLPCDVKQWFVISLSEEVNVESVELTNLEHYSGWINEFQLLGSETFPTDSWVLLGTFKALKKHGSQQFELNNDIDHTLSPRYIKVNVLSHYGDEYYCTLSSISVYGKTTMELLRSAMIASSEEVNDLITIIEESQVEDNVMETITYKINNNNNDIDDSTALNEIANVEANSYVYCGNLSYPMCTNDANASICDNIPMNDKYIMNKIKHIDKTVVNNSINSTQENIGVESKKLPSPIVDKHKRTSIAESILNTLAMQNTDTIERGSNIFKSISDRLKQVEIYQHVTKEYVDQHVLSEIAELRNTLLLQQSALTNVESSTLKSAESVSEVTLMTEDMERLILKVEQLQITIRLGVLIMLLVTVLLLIIITIVACMK